MSSVKMILGFVVGILASAIIIALLSIKMPILAESQSALEVSHVKTA